MELKVEDLCGKTPNGRMLFKDVSLSVKSRECVFVVGASGVGKSTMLRTISLLADRHCGTITLDGKEATEFTPMDWRARVTYIAQQTKNTLPGNPETILDYVKSFR